jgi:hypothetical protein
MLQSDSRTAELVGALDGDPTVMLRPLTAQERERVILGPLDHGHLDVQLDNGLLAQLLDDVTSNPDALPLLEFALAILWAKMRIDGESRILSRAVYEEIDGLSGALAQHADAVLKQEDIDERKVKRLFIELVRVGGSIEQDARRPRTRSELDAIDPGLWPLAQRLAGHRLVVTTEAPAVDIVHEALFRRWSRLSGWIEEERDFLRWRQRVDERRREWEDSGRLRSELLSGRMLEEAGRWLAERSEAIDGRQRDFIHQSQSAHAADDTRRQSDSLWRPLELAWEPY